MFNVFDEEPDGWVNTCLPPETLTPYLRSLIGSQYDMGDGHIYTIKGYVKGNTNKPRIRYVVECSVCSNKDKELWYKGSILTDKSRLDNKAPSCGKSKRISYTKEQKELILNRYLNRNNYTLLKDKDVDGFWTVRCNICHGIDPELWYDGVTLINSYNIYTGRPSCGCSEQVPWAHHQYEILIGRKCREKGYTLKECEDKLTSLSEVVLYNPTTDSDWNTNVISLLAGYSPREEYLLTKPKSGRLSDEGHVKKFLSTGKFPSGYIFKRNDIKKNFKGSYDYWDCICPICSKDVYVQEGGSTGIFTTDTGSLSNGCLPCRCSRVYKYSYREAKILATNVCNSYGGVFIEFIGEYRGIDNVKMKWLRPDGIEYVANLRDVRRGKTGLSRCGFDKHKPASFYIVRWYVGEGSFLKCGITNREVVDRVTEQARASLLDFSILHTFHHENGSVIQELEGKYKESIVTGVCSKEIFPSGYTETAYDTGENLKTILNIVGKFIG